MLFLPQAKENDEKRMERRIDGDFFFSSLGKYKNCTLEFGQVVRANSWVFFDFHFDN